MKKNKNSDIAKATEAREHLKRNLAAFEQAVIEQEREQKILNGEISESDIEDEDLNVSLKLKRAEVPPPTPPLKDKYNIDGMVDVIVFCEHPYFLNLRLTPWQKLILKVFYSGSPGNIQLKIDDKKTEDCSGCIWDYNKKFENRYYKSLLKNEEGGKNSLMPPENSPCLTCVRFDKDNRDARYEKLIEEAIRQEQLDEIDELKARELVDMFQTEMDLLEDPQIDAKVRKQILDKFGRKFQELLLVLGRRSGKALDISTPMLTTNGWTTMGDIKPGDYVYAPDGLPTLVTAITEIMENRPCYEIEFSNGEKIIADEQHEWVTETKSDRKNTSRGYNREPKTKTTKEIFESLFYARKDGKKENNHSIRLAKPLSNEHLSLPINPYMLGIWLGDGTTSNGHITSGDFEIIEKIYHDTEFNPYKQKCNKFGYCMGKTLEKKSFKEILRDTNLLNNKHIPDIYFLASYEQRLELLRGLMDTDGAAMSNGRVEFCVCNFKLAEDVFKLIASLGIKTALKDSNSKLNGRIVGKRYRMCFTPPKSINVFYLPRKSKLVISSQSSCTERLFIKNITPIESVPVKCIEVAHESHMYLAGRSLIPTHNSFLTAVITLYEVYRFLMMGHPQGRYPILEFDIITILNVAVSEGQAKMAIFDKIRQLAESSPYFVTSIGKSTQLEMYFLTDHDKEENKRRMERGQEPMIGTIQLKSGHSSASGMVGGTMAVIIIDEMAEMAPAASDGGTDDELYDKLKPAIATFGRDGKMICISNPLGPYGKFYKLYKDSFEDNSVLMAQLPTWLSNPYIPKAFLEKEKRKNPDTYHVYFGAQFGSSGSDNWIRKEYVDMAFDHVGRTRRAESGAPLTRYFAHLDPAKSSDYYTLVVCHAEPMESAIGPDGKPLQRVVVDHMHLWKAKGKNQPINSEEVDTYILKLATRFKFAQISYDQWNSQGSIQKLTNHGLNAVRKNFDLNYKSSVYGELYELFNDRRIVFYNEDTIYDNNGIAEELLEVTECKNQFINLQRKFNGKSYKIEALTGHHDDFPDAVAACAYEVLKDKVYSTLPRVKSMRINGIR